LTAEGLRVLLDSSPDLRFAWAARSLAEAVSMAQQTAPSVLIVDKAFGAQAVLDILAEMQAKAPAVATVVWGVSIMESEALRFIQAGARGIVRKSVDLESVVICLRSVAAGAAWMERNVFHDPPKGPRTARSVLTPREQQVVELVGLGMKNREVAQELGIRPGTVKVHLKHIFEKMGVQGRYGLALSGLARSAAAAE
jgi:DNA-binding NarL/FixJ family response regulator